MSATMFLEYPEFFLAALAGGLFFFLNRSTSATNLYLPTFITEPAVTVVSAMPAKYVTWLMRLQNWCGWRSNTAFGLLSSVKVYVPILLLGLLAFVGPAVTLPLVLVSFFVPDVVLAITAKRRQEQIRESLPQALDLMVLCVDAGLGLDATLQRIAAEKTIVAIALNEELQTLGRDVLLGMDRDRAYQELFRRTGVDELKALGSSLNQSAKLGLSIAKVLRTQADFLRMKLSQKAEEKAAKLPILMAFPLWFCVMPALMVVLLAPSLITFFENAPSSFAREIVK
ncbi:MAG: type II secretion system F family protein [Candidatus Melainabacteria bacterium]|nr:type II secretion system F family protein [Candidatus Melainabacteria bacterium]